MAEFLTCGLILCLYFIVLALIALTMRKLFKIPNEIFRKILHFILLGSFLIFVYVYETWWIGLITCGVFVVLVYPILMFFERFKSYSNMVTERKSGELKTSLIFVFGMFSLVIVVCLGWLNDKMLALASIYSWGFGDALAALIGTKFGKHKIYKKKSLEGTLAYVIISFVIVLSILLIRGGMPWYSYLVCSFITAVVGSVVELYTPNGLDTVSCPLASMVVLVLMLLAFGGILI